MTKPLDPDNPRARAPKGSVGWGVFLRLPEEMKPKIKKAAKRAGLTVAEWIRAVLGKELDR